MSKKLILNLKKIFFCRETEVSFTCGYSLDFASELFEDDLEISCPLVALVLSFFNISGFSITTGPPLVILQAEEVAKLAIVPMKKY